MRVVDTWPMSQSFWRYRRFPNLISTALFPILSEDFRISHFAFRIPHFAFRISRLAILNSHTAPRVSHFAFLSSIVTCFYCPHRHMRITHLSSARASPCNLLS